MFQSTHPRGVRPARWRTSCSTLWFQSTHPRGVRLATVALVLKSSSFNPRTHEGCDRCCLSCLMFLTLFQSTHPRGVRLQIDIIAYLIICFNPRTHEGCDYQSHHRCLCQQGFNPRTHEGCDVNKEIEIHDYEFQSTHPRGVRLAYDDAGNNGSSFNPRTHEGCDIM